MKRRPLAFAAAVMLAAASLSSCSDKSQNKSGSSADKSEMITEYLITDDTFQEKYANVKSAESGPHIFVNDTTAAPGETAEVTVSISNADLQWSTCGIHLTYPDVLECVLSNEEELLVKSKKGDALEAAVGLVSMLWVNQLPEALTSRHLGSMFFTTICMNDTGLDGDIATFYFVVPEDAKPGAVYNIGFYYMSGDMFANSANDISFEKYAFEHAKGGTITIV